MALVKFATICDVPDCGSRSPEYQAWPCCSECLRDLCPDHQVPGSFDEESRIAVCHDCMNREVM